MTDNILPLEFVDRDQVLTVMHNLERSEEMKLRIQYPQAVKGPVEMEEAIVVEVGQRIAAKSGGGKEGRKARLIP